MEERSRAYREKRRGRGDRDGFTAHGMRQTMEGWSRRIHISKEQWGLFSLVISAAISYYLQLPSQRKLLKWNLARGRAFMTATF